MNKETTMTNKLISVGSTKTFDVSTLEGCLAFLSEVLPEKVQERINFEVSTDPIFTTLNCTYQEFYGSMMETDPKQATQSVSKRLYYHWMSALILVVKEYGIEDILSLSVADGGAGRDFTHTPTGTPIEWKTCGGNAGTSLATGSINSLAKVDDTFVVGYTLVGNTLTSVKCVWVRNSYAKWTGYNKMTKGSGFSTLKCKPDDLRDITIFRGSLKINPEWIKFLPVDLVSSDVIETEVASIKLNKLLREICS
jgi:hypothetical protein